MIEIYDNFFYEEIRKEIYDKLMEPHWHLKGGYGKDLFWHYDNLENQEYFNKFLYELICKKLNRKFKGIKRIYANGQTAGQCGAPHFDDGDLTFLYYPAPEWHITLKHVAIRVAVSLPLQRSVVSPCTSFRTTEVYRQPINNMVEYECEHYILWLKDLK